MLPPHRLSEAIIVLCDAFRQYPVVRHTIGEIDEHYNQKLRTLVELFVANRTLREEPILAITDRTRVVAVAVISSPDNHDVPPELADYREAAWKKLGQAACERYAALCDIWQKFAIAEPQYHLNMIGVSSSHLGRRFGRLLLDSVHEMSRRSPNSHGVSLTTEDPDKVSFYEYFGYRIVGHERFSSQHETWGFFRWND